MKKHPGSKIFSFITGVNDTSDLYLWISLWIFVKIQIWGTQEPGENCFMKKAWSWKSHVRIPSINLCIQMYVLSKGRTFLGWRHVLVVGRNLKGTATRCALLSNTGLKQKMIAQWQELIWLQSIPKQRMTLSTISSTISDQELKHLIRVGGWEDQTMHQR